MTEPHPKADLTNWRQHPWSVWGFTHADELLPVARIATANPSPLPQGAAFDLAAATAETEKGPMSAAAIFDATHSDGVLVLHDGKVVAEHYVNERPETRHINFSVSKSITGTLAGILVAQGLLDPAAPVTAYVPEARGSAYGDATLRQVLDMAVSIRFVEDYLDPLGDVARYRVAMGWNPPTNFPYTTGLHGFLTTLPKNDYPHGHRFHYVSPNSDMLGWIIERAAGDTVANLLSRHIWQKIGMEHDAYVTLDAEGAPRTAGGICTSLRDLARFGELMRLNGAWNGQQVVPESWIKDIRHGGDAQAWSRGEMTGLYPHGRYRAKWYSPDADGAVLCAIGIHGQWIYIDNAAKLVAVKQSSQPIPSDEPTDRMIMAGFRALSRALR